MTDARPYSMLPLPDLLDAFASGGPTPAGGSAAAVAGALGTSLLIMVASLPKTRTGAPEEVADLAAAAARLRPLRDQLLGLVDEDSDAYGAVVLSYRMPKGSPEQKTARQAGIAAAMRRATDVPLDGLRACQQALREAGAVAAGGLSSAAGDVAVGIELLRAALRSFALSIDINVRSLTDPDFVARAKEERQQLAGDGEACAATAASALALARP